MGALSSFPCESKTVPLPHLSHFDPQGSASGSLSATEKLDGEKSCAKQASVKWQSTFARGWGPGSTPGSLEELHPVGDKCRNAGLYARPLEAPDQFWPLAFYGGVASTSLFRRGEETFSSSSVCNLGCCSQIQEVLERGDPSGHLKPHYHQKRLDPEELSSRFFHCPELRHGDTLLCLPSFDGLEVSLETLRARAPGNVGVTVDSTPREVHVTIRAPEVDQLGDGSEYVDLQELPHELAGADRGPPTVQTMDKGAFFLPAHNSLAEIPRRRLRERSSAVLGGLIPSNIGGSAPSSKNPSSDACWADVGRARAEQSSGEKNTENSECQHYEESCYGMDTVQQEESPWAKSLAGGYVGQLELQAQIGNDSEINPLCVPQRLPQQNHLLLARCFAAWRDQVLDRRAAAQVLYKRQLLRKGFTALKWAAELRRIKVGVAQRRHNRTVLAASFRQWQGAVAKQRKARAARAEKETRSRSSLAAPGGETVAKRPVLWQLSSKCREATAQYSRAEGNLWMQIIHNQGVDKLHGKAQAIRDMRSLAAAFRLWRLQKESLDEEESRARDARALLEKKRLRDAFRTWQSHHRATERVLPLVAEIQRRLLSQCFNTWKGFAEREACIRSSLDQRRIGTLRLCFQQWALMVQIQERTRKTLLKLLALRRRIAYGEAQKASLGRKGLLGAFGDPKQGPARFGLTLDSPATQPHLNVGRQSRRNAPGTVDGLYVALVRQEMFYTWKARWCQHQRLNAFRQAAKQRLLKAALGQWRLRALRPPPLRSCPRDLDAESVFTSLDLEECSVSSGFHSNTPAQPTSSYSLERESTLTDSSPGSVSSLVTIADSGPFLHHPSPSLTPSPGREDLEGEAVGFHVGASSPSRNIKAFISWSVATARTSARRHAQIWLESTRQQQLLAFCFGRWKTAVWTAQQQKEEESLRRGPDGFWATWRWRKAIRGRQALRLNTGTVVQQSCNYWTKASAFQLCLRERSSLVGAPKFMKMPLSWPSKQRRSREEGLTPSLGVRARLNGSAFHVWLMIYRSQSRAAGPSQRGLPDSPGRAEWRVRHTQAPISSAEMGSMRWLWRKYLGLWRRNILLRRFQDARMMRHLVRAWLLWKDACRAEWVVQALVRQRLTQWGWKMWRRRYLQTQVAERFLESQDGSLLRRAFETWRHLAIASPEEAYKSPSQLHATPWQI
uniref:Uncharacterized protein n=1 Tax=Sphaerodactylus townsendi TaxID=933632 RepID=A0ACB8EES1_9SAUR